MMIKIIKKYAWMLLLPQLVLAEQPYFSSVGYIPLELQEKMRQYSWNKQCPVHISQLAYVQVSYWGFDGKTHLGALIVNRQIAAQVKEIFGKLYFYKFPMQSVKPIEEFYGDDAASIAANNTSAFNCRMMVDDPNRYSKHSYGIAIDINPLQNPYVNHGRIKPAGGEKYVDREIAAPGKITHDSQAYKAFIDAGWQWGGNWKNPTDYQHFEKS